ncbi:MAG: RNA 2',3'-cyclic phosphodiesterase, partial [Methyloceanibacter sp.]
AYRPLNRRGEVQRSGKLAHFPGLRRPKLRGPLQPGCLLLAYLGRQGGIMRHTFDVTRFVLFSSRNSVGGGPYVVEAAYPLEL